MSASRRPAAYTMPPSTPPAGYLCPYVASMGVHGNMAPGSASPAASFETDVPLSDIQPNPYLPMPSTDEFMTECQALPSPRRWAALQAAKLLTAAPVTSTTTPCSRDNPETSPDVAPCSVVERVVMLMEAGISAEDREMATALGLDSVKLWIYQQSEDSSDALYPLLAFYAERFYPYVQSRQHASDYARGALQQIESITSQRQLAAFRQAALH